MMMMMICQWVHEKGTGAGCKVPRDLDVFWASWSCKDWSKLKRLRKTITVGGTAYTFQCIVDYLSVGRPFIWIGENLDDMLQDQALMDEILAALWEIEYMGRIVPLDANDQGACTFRKRGFIIAIELRDSGLKCRPLCSTDRRFSWDRTLPFWIKRIFP